MDFHTLFGLKYENAWALESQVVGALGIMIALPGRKIWKFNMAPGKTILLYQQGVVHVTMFVAGRVYGVGRRPIYCCPLPTVAFVSNWDGWASYLISSVYIPYICIPMIFNQVFKM